ncbi:hypothetical protein Syun_022853 [Stephania yunnanensis]|uniref:FAD-binding PCMH-type domain-containing protein n=1 Tax=Stephania yunnanensis TaxID=152371 RepID=A0AAP0I1U2_9MAGN
MITATLLILCTTITLPFFLLTSPTLSSLHHTSNIEALLSCLASNGVHNFTTNVNEHHRLLILMIQNPIFTRPVFSKPATIVLPQSKQQLASTIICSRRYGSWTIRLRSGGHSYEGLSHTAQTPFVVIDFMNLNRVELDLQSETAWVESGATLGELYYAISQVSDTLAFPAGICPTVGSGGHISGGGFGPLSRKYGLASDNVVDALLVDASGEIFDRESMGEAVFWAIRGGGGGSFGAIYAWKIKLVHVPEKVTAFTLYKPNMDLDVAAEFLEKWQLVGPTLDDRFTLTVAAKADTNYEPWGVLLEFHGSYLGPKSDAMSIMSVAFPELGIPEDEYLELTWVEAIAKLGRLDSPSRLKDRFLKWDDRAFKTKVDFPRSPLPLKGMRGVLEWLLKEQHGFVVMNGYNGMMSKIRKEASPFPHRNGTLMMIEYLVAWKMEEDFESDKFLSWLRDFYDYMGQFINNKPRVSYVNHVDLDLGVIDWRNQTLVSNAVEISRKWNEKYFLQNYHRLVRAKTLIDPNNVFQHPQSIPPLPGLIEHSLDDF